MNLISEYWLDGFPVAATPDEGYRSGHGRDKRVSPIYDYDDGGIGAVQWLNVTHKAAAILKSDGGWKVGGTFHLWVSAGGGTLPYEIPLRTPVRVDAGDPSGWTERREEAIAKAEEVLGLRRLTE